MGHAQLRADRHRDHSGHGRACHQRRDDAERVLGGEGNGTLGDEGDAKHRRGVARLVLVGREAVAEQLGGELRPSGGVIPATMAAAIGS